jgi:hypothetical protein
MMRRLSPCFYALALITSLPFLVPPPAAQAATCNFPLCNSQITVTQYTGPIDLGCDPGDVKVKIVVNYNCGPDCNGTVTFYRCGESSQIHTFTCGSTTYIVGTTMTWADGLTECDGVTFGIEQ